MRHLVTAGRLADDIGAIDLLVHAALAKQSRLKQHRTRSTTTNASRWSTRALPRLGEIDSPDHARLLALLCVERLWDADFDERLSLATQAVDIARRTGDKAAFVDAVRLSHPVDRHAANARSISVRWNTEACLIADDLGDPTARLYTNEKPDA